MTALTRAVFSLCLAVLFLLSNNSAASAHFIKTHDTVWEEFGKCAKMTTEISHGQGGGFFEAEVAMTKPLSFGPDQVECYRPWEFAPGRLKLRIKILKWDSSERKYTLCARSTWVTANENASKLQFDLNFAEALCGPGAYKSRAVVKFKKNGVWIKETLDAGPHYLPA